MSYAGVERDYPNRCAATAHNWNDRGDCHRCGVYKSYLIKDAVAVLEQFRPDMLSDGTVREPEDLPVDGIVHQACYSQFARDLNRIGDLEAALHGCVEALRLTREHVGAVHLPAITGWAWYDATVTATLILHAPHAVGGDT